MIRKTTTPAANSARTVSGDREDGPSVATILVFRIRLPFALSDENRPVRVLRRGIPTKITLKIIILSVSRVLSLERSALCLAGSSRQPGLYSGGYPHARVGHRR